MTASAASNANRKPSRTTYSRSNRTPLPTSKGRQLHQFAVGQSRRHRKINTSSSGVGSAASGSCAAPSRQRIEQRTLRNRHYSDAIPAATLARPKSSFAGVDRRHRRHQPRRHRVDLRTDGRGGCGAVRFEYANGAIVVTTKRGKAGRFDVTFRQHRVSPESRSRCRGSQNRYGTGGRQVSGSNLFNGDQPSTPPHNSAATHERFFKRAPSTQFGHHVRAAQVQSGPFSIGTVNSKSIV